MRLNGLDAAEVGGPPYLQALVPRNRVDQTVVDGEASNGVSVLNPEPFLVATDVDVVAGENETAQTVVNGWESSQELVPFAGRRHAAPDSDLAVLVRGEDPAVAEGDGLDGAGRGATPPVERIEVRAAGWGGSIVDVDFVRGSGVEEVTVHGEAGDGKWGLRTTRSQRGRAGVRDGDVQGFGGELLEGRDRLQGLEGEVAVEAGARG